MSQDKTIPPTINYSDALHRIEILLQAREKKIDAILEIVEHIRDRYLVKSDIDYNIKPQKKN